MEHGIDNPQYQPSPYSTPKKNHKIKSIDKLDDQSNETECAEINSTFTSGMVTTTTVESKISILEEDDFNEFNKSNAFVSINADTMNNKNTEKNLSRNNVSNYCSSIDISNGNSTTKSITELTSKIEFCNVRRYSKNLRGDTQGELLLNCKRTENKPGLPVELFAESPHKHQSSDDDRLTSEVDRFYKISQYSASNLAANHNPLFKYTKQTADKRNGAQSKLIDKPYCVHGVKQDNTEESVT